MLYAECGNQFQGQGGREKKNPEALSLSQPHLIKGVVQEKL